jgi:hypothetical protein
LTQEVYDEIRRAAGISQPGCHDILAATWLGDPLVPEIGDLRGIYALQVGLNDGREPPTAHGGEAEGIYFASKLDGHFITVDNAAYDFAARRLGAGRAHDTVDLLREAVAYGDMDGGEALNIANAIRNSGRYLRRVHPTSMIRNYFER